MLDGQQQVIEATQSNIFIRKGGKLMTPELNKAGVAGVMRETILQYADMIGIDAEISDLTVDDVNAADELFVSNSLIGLWPVKRFLDRTYSDFSTAQTLLDSLREHGAI